MASWIGYATTSFTSAPNSISLPLKAQPRADSKYSSASDSTNSRTLLSICTENTPPCILNPFLPGGHAQTIYTAFTKSSRRALLHYKRRVFISNSTLYPGSFAVDFVSRKPANEDVPTVNLRTTHFEGGEWERFEQTGCVDQDDEQVTPENDRPILVALHGISGGAHELYVRSFLDPLAHGEPTTRGGDKVKPWDCLVVNARGCANSDVPGDRLFNARATWDVRQVVDWLHKQFPKRKLFGVGFSLGGNILVNYLGEEGANTPLSAAVICSNPWNLEAGSLALQRTWIGREVYSTTLGAGMKKLFERHVESIKKCPGVDIEKVRATKYLHDFDRELQGPTWGYPTEGAYYRDASSTEPLLAVRVPVFAIHADDDPVAPREVCPFEETKQNPFVVLCTTDMGGHLSWFESGGGRWYVKPGVNFLRAAADEVDFDALRASTLNQANGKPVGTAKQPIFDPLRRKLHVPQ